jgi:hypothetical protein
MYLPDQKGQISVWLLRVFMSARPTEGPGPPRGRTGD